MNNRIIVFTAAWCGPCKMLKPMIEQVSTEFPDIPVEYIDIDTEHGESLINQYNVRGVPTLLAIEDGKPISSHTGTSTKDNLVKFFQKLQ